MAQGDVFIDGDGKIGIDATGKIRLVDASSDCPDCCDSCTASGTSCSLCSGTTPSQYEATFDSTSLCTSCFNISFGFNNYDAQASYLSGFDPNTAHTLTQSGSDPCVWEKTYSSVIRVTKYSSTDGSCTTSTGTVDLDATVSLSKESGKFTLLISVGSSGSSDFGYLFFKSENAISDGAGGDLCTEVPDFTNAYTSCGHKTTPVTGIAYATDGTATVVCL